MDDFAAYERSRHTEWGPQKAGAADGPTKSIPAALPLAPGGVYSLGWETRMLNARKEATFDSDADEAYVPPLGAPDPANPTAWFDLRVQGAPLGRVVVELKADACPRTVENFQSLCSFGCYKGSYFHRVVPGFVAQGGDYQLRCPITCPPDAPGECFDLSLVEYRAGGRSIFGDRPDGLFECENFDLKHAGPGVLAMAGSETLGLNGSQFYVTLADGPLPELDGRFTVFGQVIEGWGALKALEAVGSERGSPVQSVVVEDAGLLTAATTAASASRRRSAAAHTRGAPPPRRKSAARLAPARHAAARRAPAARA